jgi:hypothetical protein
MRAQWWEQRKWAWMLLLLVALPLVVPPIPPLLDLPGHMGRYAVGMANEASDISRYYTYRWAIIGNLGVDLLVVPFRDLVGIERATKLVTIIIPILTSAGFLLAAREVHGRLPATAPLALVFAYSYPFHYGFVNYSLGMAFVALAFPLWIRLRDESTRKRALIFAAIAAGVWITHAIAWVALCVLCGSYDLQGRLRSGEQVSGALIRTLLAGLPLGTGLVLTALSTGGEGLALGSFLDFGSMAKAAISLNRDRWIFIDLATSAMLVIVLALAITRRMGLAITPHLGWPAAALLLLFIAIPDNINDSAFLKTRVLPWAVAYALLAIDVPVAAKQTRWAIFSAGVLFVRLGATFASLLAYSASFESALAALQYVPAGSRIATFTANGCKPTLANWTNSRRQHLGGIAIIRKRAFVNDQFAASSLQLLQVQYAQAGKFSSSPSEVVAVEACERNYPPAFATTLDELPRGAFDYVWLLDVPREAWPTRTWLRPVYGDDATMLYAVSKPSTSGANR